LIGALGAEAGSTEAGVDHSDFVEVHVLRTDPFGMQHEGMDIGAIWLREDLTGLVAVQDADVVKTSPVVAGKMALIESNWLSGRHDEFSVA